MRSTLKAVALGASVLSCGTPVLAQAPVAPRSVRRPAAPLRVVRPSTPAPPRPTPGGLRSFLGLVRGPHEPYDPATARTNTDGSKPWLPRLR